MFTYIKLKNFMSFKNTTFNFTDGNKGVKKFISIYGENGSGKTHFVNSIEFLYKITNSFNINMINFQKNLTNLEGLLKSVDIEELSRLIDLNSTPYNFSDIFKDYRMIDCDENTYIEYGFQINGYKGYYIIEFKEQLLYEKLYYLIDKQRGMLFEVKYVNNIRECNISKSIVKTDEIKNELENEIDKYWGKHTLLSIIQKEKDEKNKTYIEKNISKNILDVLDMFKNISIYCHRSSEIHLDISIKPRNILKNLSIGIIKASEEYQLDCSEKILKNFFTQAYADIKDIYYIRLQKDSNIIYELMVKKVIGGKIRNISFSKESSGTQHVLNIISSLFGAFLGVTVVYDEIDDGIHDLLLLNIINSMLDDITGQLIITTHNTLLLEKINIKSAYIINVDFLGNKDARCLNEYQRIQSNNNLRIMYLKGLFGGIPCVEFIDYDEVINELKNTYSSMEDK